MQERAPLPLARHLPSKLGRQRGSAPAGAARGFPIASGLFGCTLLECSGQLCPVTCAAPACWGGARRAEGLSYHPRASKRGCCQKVQGDRKALVAPAGAKSPAEIRSTYSRPESIFSRSHFSTIGASAGSMKGWRLSGAMVRRAWFRSAKARTEASGWRSSSAA